METIKDDVKEIEPIFCPFCGEESPSVVSNTTNTGFYVHCHGCGADGPWSRYKESAITLWNRRHEQSYTTSINTVFVSE